MRPVSTSSLVEQVRNQMQDAITTGTFQPGDRIVESDVAATLGVSRGPVREAARLLEQKGLVISIPRRGFFVREFSRTQIEDLYELREWIQVAAVRCAVDRATDTDLARLRRRHQALVGAAREQKYAELVEGIVDYHRMLCALSGNARLMRVFDDIAIEVSQILSVLGVGDVAPPVEVDISLIEAVEARQPDRAAEEMRRYVRAARQEVLEHFEKRQGGATRRSVA